MENLKITLIQPDILWENPQANLKKYAEMLEEVENTDVIVLPETFTTGFTMNSKKFSEKMDAPPVNRMKILAAKKNACLVGSLIIDEAGKIFNRAVWVFPDGRLEVYDKRHLFTMGEEDRHYSRGNKKLIVEYKGWRFCPLICYDLRFPVWSRNTENYDVLIYMANWPAARHHVWEILLKARAIENQVYCVGVNRVGTDGAGINYLGGSALISPKGFSEVFDDTEQSRTFELSYSDLHNFRKSFPVLNDKDEFKVL